ncbi:MAG: glycosyltransferase [Pseudomonadota bacterium]
MTLASPRVFGAYSSISIVTSESQVLSGTPVICDLTQSYSAKGGGIRTYLAEKRQFLIENSDAHHCLIVPGEEDRIIDEGRWSRIEIASPKVPGSPNYRLLLRSPAVVKALRHVMPDTIECLDAYNLPWAALYHRRKFPRTALIAGYHTDFPTVYVEKFLAKRVGKTLARGMKSLSYKYAANLYRRFDAFYTLTESAAAHFETLRTPGAKILPLGADTVCFDPNKRSAALRTELGVGDDGPLLIYAGRIDREKKARVIVEAFKKLPASWRTGLVMLGNGNEREALVRECEGYNAHFPGYVDDRQTLAKYLASSDIYVSAMEDETFGISVVEAQSAGLPVVGVRAGAMVDRVRPHLGRLGAPGDAGEMAANIAAVWMDRLSPMRDHARQHILDNFSWRMTFEALYYDIYRKAIAARAPELLNGFLGQSQGVRRKAI